MNKKAQKQCRLHKVNYVISEVASCGRKFFRHNEDVSCFVFKEYECGMSMKSRSRLYFVDKYSKAHLPCWNDPGNPRWNSRIWHKFTDGGTLKSLVKSMACYIYSGSFVPSKHFGPWPEWCCGGDPWGYGDDIARVRWSARCLQEELELPCPDLPYGAELPGKNGICDSNIPYEYW